MSENAPSQAAPSPADARKHLDSAKQKAQAACAILADRRCAAHDAIPPLHLGFCRLAAALGHPPQAEALAEVLRKASVAGLDTAESARAATGVIALAAARAQLAEADPTAPGAAELRWLAYALDRAATVGRRQLDAAAPLRAPKKVLLGAAGLLVLLTGSAVFATSAPAEAPVHGWRGTYFKAHALTGGSEARVDPELAFFWANASPLPGIPIDHFSARWDGCLRVDQDGVATFAVGSDDESRVLVDGKQLIDSWKPHSMSWKQGTTRLTEGLHHVRVEYGEEAGDASVMLKLGWNGALPEPIDPSLILLPTGDGDHPCGSPQ